jgi:hypothetical protein
MEDVYPIAINSTFNKWGTPCNTTYGDCGCDNCEGNVQDVSSRLDNLRQYEAWLGLWPKTKAHNPQTFNGENYWSRDPTDEEEVAMNALAFHHDAKAIASWVWPFSDSLGKIMGKFGSTVARQPVANLIVTGKAERVQVQGHQAVDAAYWVGEKQVLVSVVNGGYYAIDGEISIPLPPSLGLKKEDDAVVWGNGTWTLDNGQVRLSRQSGMATNMMLLDIGNQCIRS